MTATDVLLDTWAWVEILARTPAGVRLRRKYFDVGGFRVHTSCLTLGELTAKLDAEGLATTIEPTLASIEQFSTIHDLTAKIAREGGRLRSLLREKSPHAGLVDGIILAAARELQAVLLSGDPAFQGLPDVRSE